MSDTLAIMDPANNEVSPTVTTSHKALRKARKTAVKATNDAPARVVADVEVQTQEPAPSDDIVKYECCICGEDFPVEEGVAPCISHFLCASCVVDAHNAALNDIDAFPVQCCNPLPPRAVEHILTPEVIAAYKAKIKEYNTHPVLRIYCVNDDCHMFIPVEKFEDHSLSTVAPCDCGTKTCVGCKDEWKDDRHKCLNAGAKPD
jgi:hypothetical protein